MTPGGDTSSGQDFQERVLAAVQTLDPHAGHAAYRTVYGGEKKALFFKAEPGKRSSLVITVWQGVGGTVDEKFPFIFANAEAQVPLYDRVFIVIGGEGASGGARSWLAEQVHQRGPLSRVHLLEGADALQGACQRYAAHGEWSGIS